MIPVPTFRELAEKARDTAFHLRDDHAYRKAQMYYHDRVTPATMLAVYEALETVARLPVASTYPDGPCLEREDHKEIMRALRLLDGVTDNAGTGN